MWFNSKLLEEVQETNELETIYNSIANIDIYFRCF